MEVPEVAYMAPGTGDATWMGITNRIGGLVVEELIRARACRLGGAGSKAS